MTSKQAEPIAIVGMAARFPGCEDLDAFWQLLSEGRDAISSLNDSQLGASVSDYQGAKGQSDRFYCDQGGYIRQLNFSPEGYARSADEMATGAQTWDQHLLWALDCARKALQSAGLTPAQNASDLARCGAVMGTLSFPTRASNKAFLPLYHHSVDTALRRRFPGMPPLASAIDAGTAADAGIRHWDTDIAAQGSELLCDCLGLGGPSLSLDAACASSVYALRLACDYLSNHSADVMLAGAVSGADPFFIHMGFSIFQAFPESGQSAPLDNHSGGLFAGEGCGVLVLKRLSDAQRDGDTIHGIIRGTGLSNDGRGQFVLSPASKGQVLAFERAAEAANIAPSQVEVIECHATGTPLGDKVELSSMEQFFGPRLEGSAAPKIGSVKSNLSHLLTASGMAGIIKLLLSMKHKLLPASVRISAPLSSPNGVFGEHNIVRSAIPWPTKAGNTGPVAGVSVFGFGGCNAHLLLTGPDAAKELIPAKPSPGTATNQGADYLAIEGAAAHFGAADSLETLAKLIAKGQTATRALPPKRWKGLERNRSLLSSMGLEQAPNGGYIDKFELDFLKFRLPPHPGDRLVAQQLLLLKVADDAIRDAHLPMGGRVAVLVAMETELELHQFRGRVNLHSQISQSLNDAGINLSQDEYLELERLAMDSVLPSASLNQYTSYIGNIMASRVASQWDFNGPAFSISAAELSVPRALEVAANLCRTEALDAVVVAAVDLAGSAERVLYSGKRLQQLGLLPGEGAGALVLTPSVAHQSGRYGALTELSFKPFSSVELTTTEPLSTADSREQAFCRNAQPEIDEHSPSIKAFRRLAATSHSAVSRMGHSFAAAGMASLLHSLLRLTQDRDKDSHTLLIDGERRCAAVNLQQSAEQKARLQQALRTQNKKNRQENSQGASEKPSPKIADANVRQLWQTITLGGDAIEQHIATAELKHETGIRQKLAQAKNTQAQAAPAMHTSSQQVNSELTKELTPVNNQHAPSALRQSVPGDKTAAATHRAATEAHLQALADNQRLAREAHLAFLKSRETGLALASALLGAGTAAENRLSAENIGSEDKRSAAQNSASVAPLPARTHNDSVQTAAEAIAKTITPKATSQVPKDKPCIWNYQDLVQYAEGDIAPVFGPEYAVIDSYRRRVRLPTTDYLLVSRVTKLNARLGEYKPSTMTTEYDIPVDAPYLVDGQIPWAVAVESGQCDLMLISYLGIDLENKGERVYRLLDCTLTFLGDLPRGGDTLRYDISINHFARNGDTLLFFFSYECFVGERLILKMDNGCAGFFTDAELADGKGVIRTEEESKARNLAMANKRQFQPLIHCKQQIFDYQRMRQLLSGDIGACFGPSHDLGYRQASLCFASEKFLMIEEVSRVEPSGGAWGLGLVEGHKRLEPDHWYFPCHFKDDQVMAGSLMAEGCGQLLQFYMLYLGLHKHTRNGRFQPLESAPQKVRCRGQVQPQSNRLTYRMEVTEIGLIPSPWAKANIEILLDGKVVVDFQDLGVMLKEDEDCHRYADDSNQEHSRKPQHPAASASDANKALNAGRQASINAPLMSQESCPDSQPIHGVIPVRHVPAPVTPDYPNRRPDTAPFTPWHMFEFATGDIENCFGPDFAAYRGLIPPRTPCGDLQLTTRVTQVIGQRGDFKSPASCIGEYEVPPKAWYFSENSHPAHMPYSILMEIALQPNGFISGYMGTTLGYGDTELFFRNLDGKGTLLRRLDLRGKTISNDSRLLSTVKAGTNIIQSFSFVLSADGEPFYEGEAVFGYFKAEALKNQLGLDNGKVTEPWDKQQGLEADVSYDLRAADCALYHGSWKQKHLRLPGGRLNFVDSIRICRQGGHSNLGYIYGERKIDAADWFFRFHFHQDPVMPGSLGVEAMLELLSAFALDAGLGSQFSNPRFAHCLSQVQWKYRGQINPLNRQMSLELHITAIEDTPDRVTLTADAWLAKDGLRIYEIKDLALAIEEA
ncbi:beta-hydroxyacyl-ACP dehydratase [Shewanella carassii]|uniref:hotdog fold thioesterase n=1 Tax=Shewanella carassii TaxID=1987584 RepID=UPI001BF06175|nr:beta-ketoacyl synthase N-terminal-like domain-containing protein [Shewanella carassii]BCV65849.1 beta-hydroxyacyl-ACP dehydratase [Shewanella carassii]